MTLSAEERSRINKENASHARGPVTEAGRARSKLNALRHGGRCQTLVVLPNEDPDAVQVLRRQWEEFYQPRSPAEAAFIDKAVLALQKSERLRRAEHQGLADQVRSAQERLDAAQDEAIELLAESLKEDPAPAVRGLMRTAAGCRWMLGEWDDIKAELDENGAWATSRREHAVRLMGLRPEDSRHDETAYLIRLWNLVALPNRSEEALCRLLEPQQVPDTIRPWQANMEPDIEDCRKFLAEAVDREVAMLREREERLRTEIEEPARAGAAERALVLEGEEGRKLHRYQVTAENDFHRAYNGFLKARAREEGLVDMAPPAPLPNEPNPAVDADPSPLESADSVAAQPSDPGAGCLPPGGPVEPLPNEPNSARAERPEVGRAESPGLPILPLAAGIEPATLAESAPIG